MEKLLENQRITEGTIALKPIEEKRCITGAGDYLYPHISKCMERAKDIKIIVSFVMESGVRLLENDLKNVINSGKNIQILTGNYLNITQPSALYLLRDILGEDADIRFYSDKSRSFHPKAYIFQYEDGDGDIFIGSSNMSKSALTRGLEWNYRIRKKTNEEDFQSYLREFEKLFINESIIVNDEELKNYSKSWIRPKVMVQIEKEDLNIVEGLDLNGNEGHRNTKESVQDYPNSNNAKISPKEYEKETNQNPSNVEITYKDIEKVQNMFQPRGAQIEALYMLKKFREEGLDKSLVVAATGIGKTYLAAFDSSNFNRILFIAHREEILKQAERTFKTVRTEKSTGFFMGNERNTENEIIFGSVQTLGKKEYLCEEYFKKDAFDYIILDETHHAVANNYRNIIDYFEPKFVLGLTATPDRLDNKDVYALFDYNVAYEVNLKGAINKGWLVPFRYYGIYDESIDYNNIQYKNGKYNEKQLESALAINNRAELILKHYNKFKSQRALGFCSSKKHAEFMAAYFNQNGVKAGAVYSGDLGDNGMHRESALRALKNGELNIIFSVDMFNEGLDIKTIDMVLFLRPTESPTVFLQQLGRGLRQDGNKKYLNVLDFIGNYKKANLIPFLLKGTRTSMKAGGKAETIPNEEDFPEDCLVDFDIKLIDIFKQMEASTQKIQDIIDGEFYRIKEDLGRVPSRTEAFTYIDEDIYENMKGKSKYNFFKNYLQYLERNNEIAPEEKGLMGTFGEEFINMLETTSMSKTYKMPILVAFYNNGNIKTTINNEDIYRSFKDFYSKGSNGVDLSRDKGTSDYKNWNEEEYVKLARKNPIKFLEKTHGEFFYLHENGDFSLNNKIVEFIGNEAFKNHFKDVIDYRTVEFYKSRNLV